MGGDPLMELVRQLRYEVSSLRVEIRKEFSGTVSPMLVHPVSASRVGQIATPQLT